MTAPSRKSPENVPAPAKRPLQGRELAIPKYDYQSPRSGSFVIRYQDDEERKKTTTKRSGGNTPAKSAKPAEPPLRNGGNTPAKSEAGAELAIALLVGELRRTIADQGAEDFPFAAAPCPIEMAK
jgi:hypothetical protein